MTDELAQHLADFYGPNPQDVGAEDGTEDDFGDLLSEAFNGLGFTDDDETWERFQDKACESQATTMQAFLDDLKEVKQ